MGHRMLGMKRLSSLVLMMGLAIGGCAADHLGLPANGPGEDRSKLAGLWDYEEGTVVVVLTLDEQGRGEYLYKGGRFETTSLQGARWRGHWSQEDNDREGDFEFMLNDDLSHGEGRWWYTRVGGDQSPKQSGGTFHISRSDSTPPSKAIVTRPKSHRHGE